MDTIFAPATAPGRAGVAVLRISGPAAPASLLRLGCPLPPPRMATLVSLRAPDTSERIDHALALYFPAPASFTGEDVVELHLHGSRAVMEMLLTHLGAMEGMRLAEPGEFSRRAFFHGKMDLTQAEAIADLIDAETTAQQRQAIRQMDGALGRACDALRTNIIETRAHLEAYLDFPDEDIPPSVATELDGRIAAVAAQVDALLHDAGRGEKIRDGFYAVILGAPNAGKSTLLNALARRDVAIVSPSAGTTRDILEAHLDLGGYPLTLADTAGLRETAEPVEAEGIRRAQARAAQADWCVRVLDATAPRTAQGVTLEEIKPNDVLVLNKIDASPLYIDEFADLHDAIPVSAKDGLGLERLISQFKARMQERLSGTQDAVITRARHRDALREAQEHLAAAQNEVAPELKGECLRLAGGAIGRITGAIHIEDVLDAVFRSFCIGK